MAIKTAHPRTFDDAKLAAMVEPLTIRIEKIKGTSRTPIPLPEAEDGKSAGTEWAKDDVRNVENWLVTQWAGGGLYEITVTDSSTPPNVMKWSPFWSPSEYPELMPPPLAAARAQNTNPSAPTTPTQQVRPVASAFPNGLPTLPLHTPTTSVQPQPQWYPQPQYFVPQPPLPAAPTPGSPQWAAWQDAAEKRKMDEEIRLLREQNAQRERDAMNAKHEAQLAAERQASEQRTRALEQQISELRNLMTTQNATSQKNPELEAMRLQMEQQRQLMEAQMRQTEEARRQAEEARKASEAKADAERRDRETRDLIQRQAEESRRQLEEMRRQHETTLAALTANANKGPDPMITMMLQLQQQQAEASKEAARQNAEAIKEITRQSTAQIQQLQGSMMTPMQAIQLVKDSAQQSDGATAKVQQLFGTVIDMQQKVMENALQMQPSGSPVPQLIEKGIDTVQQTIERYVGHKSAEERVKATAQAQMVEAQSRAYIAQQQAASGQPVQPQPVPTNVPRGPITPPPPRVEQQLAGSTAPTEVVTGDGTKRLGRTDDQWFGPLVGEVDQLRMGIDRFMESATMDPPRLNKEGQLEGISPEMAAMGVLQAINEVLRRGVAIPAMVELLFQERFADFMDVLIPNAPQAYRDDVVKMVAAEFERQKKLEKGEPVNEEGTSGDDDDDDDGDDDGDDAKKEEAKSPAPTKPVKAKNGRTVVTH